MISSATKNKFSTVELPSSPEISNQINSIQAPSIFSFTHKKQRKINIMKNLENGSLPKDEIIMTSNKQKPQANIIHRDFIVLNEENPPEASCQKNWRESRFRHLMFNPEGSADLFCRHLIKIYEGLTNAKTFLESPKLEAIARKSVVFKRIGSKLLKLMSFFKKKFAFRRFQKKVLIF